MEISKGIEIIDLCIYAEGSLIISDIHMGYEEYLGKKGILIPKAQFNDTIARLEKIFKILETKKLEVETIIINGDLKHEFGEITETEWRDTLKLIDFLSKRCNKIILIKGNHDKVLEPIAEKRNVEIKTAVMLGNILVCHGDEIPEKALLKDARTIIIGHEHPSISLREEGRVENYKCFLIGKWKGKELIVMPSFNLVTEGSDVLTEEKLSPFLQQKLDNFEVFVAGDETLKFGRLKGVETGKKG